MAKRLARNGVTVQLIEQDEDRCVELSDKLPKELCCNNIVRYVRAMQNTAGAALTLHNIAEGQAEALEFVVDEKTRYIGTPLRDMKTKANVLIVCISHGSKTEIPSGDSMYQKGDSLIVVAKSGMALLQINDIFE